MSIANGVAKTLLEQIDVKQIGDDVYESVRLPGRMGNSRPIAYGGGTAAVAVYAACHTVKSDFKLYSVLGYFLGPSLVDRCVRCHVYRTRDTKSFATRRVVLSQTLDDGSERKCMELTADFQIVELAQLYHYSPSPALVVHTPDQCPTSHELMTEFVNQNHVDASRGALFEDTFSLMARFWEWRPCPEGVAGQNLSGFAKHRPTTQDHRRLPDKISMEWQKCKHDLGGHAEQAAALTFNMDGGLSFLPLLHDHKFLEDAGACSSLDFALRIFSQDLRLTDWHLKERRTIAAQGGRTYSEARLFDESGNLVAIESQQSIMRPLPVLKSPAKL